MTDVVMPQMGESIYEATITKWLKNVGDMVARDELLFEISTDKIDTEIPSPVAGKLTKILVEEGKTVPIQTVVAVIGAASEAVKEAPKTEAPAPASAEAPAGRPVAVPEDEEFGYTRRITAPGKIGGAAQRVLSSPLVRKMARANDIDLSTITGSGWKNRITKKDIEEVIQQRGSGRPAVTAAAPAPAPAAAPAGPVARGEHDRVEPMSTMRAKIAEHMVLSRHTSAHVTTVFEVDLTAVDRVRRAEKDVYERVYGTKLTFTQ